MTNMTQQTNTKQPDRSKTGKEQVNTLPEQKDWEVLDKIIRKSLILAYEDGKEQYKLPYEYLLETDKLGQPVFDFVVQNFISKEELGKKITEMTKDIERSYLITEHKKGHDESYPIGNLLDRFFKLFV